MATHRIPGSGREANADAGKGWTTLAPTEANGRKAG